MALTLAEANRMIQAAIAKAEELNVKVSVAVCDAGGHLLACNRMAGASAVSATVAQGKAAASAGFGRPSGALAADSPVIQSIIATLGGAHAAGPGGRADVQEWRTGRGCRRQWRDGSTG
jgi:glc operon protein GlcG